MLPRPFVRLPVESCFFQRTLPSFRSRKKSSRSLLSSGVETKTESSQTAGVAPLWPGSGVLHFTPSVSLHVDGRFFSGDEPLKFGPRHCAQFSAGAVKAVETSAARAKMR